MRCRAVLDAVSAPRPPRRRRGDLPYLWESNIKQYEAGTSIALQAAKINTDAVLHTNDARMEGAKVGLTTSSQRLASAWSMVGASASISGQATLSQTI